MSRKHKKRKAEKQAVVRNTVAKNPLLGKSAAHEKSGKSKRAAEKVQLKKTWFERVAATAATGQSHVLLSVSTLSSKSVFNRVTATA